MENDSRISWRTYRCMPWDRFEYVLWNQGYIDFDDITSGAHDYWTLGSPYENSKNEKT